jgi:hypothetical protein
MDCALKVTSAKSAEMSGFHFINADLPPREATPYPPEKVTEAEDTTRLTTTMEAHSRRALRVSRYHKTGAIPGLW